jgi:hypothetical protein
MKTSRHSIGLWTIVTFGAVATFVGCNGLQTSPTSSASQSGAQAVRHLSDVSNTVDIVNSWEGGTIYGSGSAPCWSTSPSPLPSVGPSASSPPVTITYDMTCVTNQHLDLTYGPVSVSTGYLCTFDISYNGTPLFNYSVTQGSSTNCSAVPSATSEFNEILTYNQILPPSAKRRLGPRLTH